VTLEEALALRADPPAGPLESFLLCPVHWLVQRGNADRPTASASLASHRVVTP
jgi:hypothetical protein